MSGVAPEVLLYSLLLGVGTGLIFTVLEAARILLSLGKVITFLADMLFGIVTAAVTFILALAVSGGSLRFFQLGCEILGFACVYLTVTYTVQRFLPRLMRFCKTKAEKAHRRTNAVVKKILRKKTERKPAAKKKCAFFGIQSKKNEKKT